MSTLLKHQEKQQVPLKYEQNFMTFFYLKKNSFLKRFLKATSLIKFTPFSLMFNFLFTTFSVQTNKSKDPFQLSILFSTKYLGLLISVSQTQIYPQNYLGYSTFLFSILPIFIHGREKNQICQRAFTAPLILSSPAIQIELQKSSRRVWRKKKYIGNVVVWSSSGTWTRNEGPPHTILFLGVA